VRARIQTVETLDRAAAKIQKGLRIFVRDEPARCCGERLDKAGDRGEGRARAGEVNLIGCSARAPKSR